MTFIVIFRATNTQIERLCVNKIVLVNITLMFRCVQNWVARNSFTAIHHDYQTYTFMNIWNEWAWKWHLFLVCLFSFFKMFDFFNWKIVVNGIFSKIVKLVSTLQNFLDVQNLYLYPLALSKKKSHTNSHPSICIYLYSYIMLNIFILCFCMSVSIYRCRLLFCLERLHIAQYWTIKTLKDEHTQ